MVPFDSWDHAGKIDLPSVFFISSSHLTNIAGKGQFLFRTSPVEELHHVRISIMIGVIVMDIDISVSCRFWNQHFSHHLREGISKIRRFFLEFLPLVNFTLQLKTTFWPGLTVMFDITASSILGGPHVLTGGLKQSTVFFGNEDYEHNCVR